MSSSGPSFHVFLGVVRENGVNEIHNALDEIRVRERADKAELFARLFNVGLEVG